MRADTNNKFIQYWCEFGCNFCFSSLLKDDNNDGVDDENQRRRRKKLKIKQHKQTMTLTQYDSVWLWVNSAIISFPSVMNACFQFHIVSVKQTTNTLILHSNVVVVVSKWLFSRSIPFIRFHHFNRCWRWKIVVVYYFTRLYGEPLNHLRAQRKKSA